MALVLKFGRGNRCPEAVKITNIDNWFADIRETLAAAGGDEDIQYQRCYKIEREMFCLNIYVAKHSKGGAILYAQAEYQGERDAEVCEFVVDYDRVLTLDAAVALMTASEVYYGDPESNTIWWRAMDSHSAVFEAGIVLDLDYNRDQVVEIQKEARNKARALADMYS